MPKVSVIIPTYNCAKYLNDAISSVLEQTFSDYEIIVVDDGSQDNTKNIVEELIKRFPDKIQYIYQSNKGPSSARNRGIEIAKGEYIAFLDADDIWLKDKLKSQLELMSKFDAVGLVGCGVYVIDEFGKVTKVIKGNDFSNQGLLPLDLMIRNVISGGPSGVLIRKECFNKVGLFDETLRGSEDRDMWLRIEKIYEIKSLEQPLVKYRIHRNNSHKNILMMKYYQKRFVYKYLDAIGPIGLKRAYSYIYLNAAREYYAVSKRIPAAINAIIAIIYFPFKIYTKDDKYQLFVKSFLTRRLLFKIKGKPHGKKN